MVSSHYLSMDMKQGKQMVPISAELDLMVPSQSQQEVLELQVVE